MSYNPWDILAGNQKFIDNGGASQYDEVKLEVGKPFQYRIVGDPFIYQEHRIDGFKDGKQTVRFIRCKKTHENPTAECKLCDADKALRRRVVCNVYSYSDNAIKTLNIGMKAFEVIAQMKAMGMQIDSTKFATTKNGTGLNTNYVTIQCGMDTTNLAPFMEQQKNLEELYKPHTDEDIKKICEGIGVSFEDATTPPQLNYPTLEEAKRHVLPFGKYKGKTMGEVWGLDRSPNGYISWLATKSTRYNDEKACAMVIYQLEGGVPLGINVANTQGEAPTMQRTNTVTNTTAPISLRDEISKLLASPKAMESEYSELEAIFLEATNNRTTNIAEMNEEELQSIYMNLQFMLG